MIYHSTVAEVHRHFPRLKIPDHEGIYKLSDDTDKLAFVILPINGGKPIQVSNGYPEDKFKEEYTQVLLRYYRYPQEFTSEEFVKGFAVRTKEMEERLKVSALKFCILYTMVIVIFGFIVAGCILLGQPPAFFWVIYFTAIFLWIAFVWILNWRNLK